MSDPNASNPPSYQPAQPYQNGGSPQGYGQAPQSQKTNLLAILSLVGAFVFSLAGLILGIIALKQIKETGEQGRGLALAGIIISALSIVISIIAAIVIISAGAASVDMYSNM
jgi:Na+/H+-dicarboxylate symporter